MSENNQMMSVEGQLVGLPIAGPESFSQQQLDYLKRALGVDETVLWEDPNGLVFSAKTITLSESWFNFTYIKLYVNWFNNTAQNDVLQFIPRQGTYYQGSIIGSFTDSWQYAATSKPYLCKASFHSDSTGVTVNLDRSWILEHGQTAWSERNNALLYKVIGFRRVSGGNQ